MDTQACSAKSINYKIKFSSSDDLQFLGFSFKFRLLQRHDEHDHGHQTTKSFPNTCNVAKYRFSVVPLATFAFGDDDIGGFGGGSNGVGNDDRIAFTINVHMKYR